MPERLVSAERKYGIIETVSRPFFIVVGVTYVLGNWAQNIAVIGWISKVCRFYVHIWREVWIEFFAWARNWVRIDLLGYQLDLLTLIATVVIISGIVPFIISGVTKSIGKTTARQDAQEPLNSETKIRGNGLSLIEWLLVALSIFLITFPFLHSYSLFLSAMSDGSNAITAKTADIIQSTDASSFLRLILSPFVDQSETMRRVDYWSAPFFTLSIMLWILMRKTTAVSLLAIIGGTAMTPPLMWHLGVLDGIDVVAYCTNLALTVTLGLFLGIGLRYSARSFVYIAVFSVLIMSVDFAVTAVDRIVNSIERSADIKTQSNLTCGTTNRWEQQVTQLG